MKNIITCLGFNKYSDSENQTQTLYNEVLQCLLAETKTTFIRNQDSLFYILHEFQHLYREFSTLNF